jgi:hypothetical protein
MTKPVDGERRRKKGDQDTHNLKAQSQSDHGSSE